MSAPPSDPKPRRVGPFTFFYSPRVSRGQGRWFHPKIALAVGALVILVHDVAYRQTGGDDFEPLVVLSHAGLDMVLLTVLIAVVLVIVGRKR